MNFEGALLSGYAPDGGLFMPQSIPSLDRDTLRRWSSLSYPGLVKELCSLFIPAELVPRNALNGELSEELLAGMCTRIWGVQMHLPAFRPSSLQPPEDGACCTIACSFLYPVLLCHLAGTSGKGVPCV